MSGHKDLIPAQPFMRWLEDRMAYHTRVCGGGHNSAASRCLCIEIGWDKGAYDTGARRLYRYRHGISESTVGKVRSKGIKGKHVILPRSMYPRDVVEDALHHAGLALEDVYPPEMYPALFEDIPLEPECWCPSCQAPCTPIRGVCPWCEWGVSDQDQRELAA